MSRRSFGIDKKINDFGFSRPNRSSGISIDTNAAAFLTAAGITDPIISSSINTLVVQLKADNIWSKMKAIYPMVGGTASTHKWNLKDPRDLDAAFRLSFTGGWTHSSNGALPNGVNGYADTKINSNLELTLINMHLSAYITVNDNSGSPYDIGNANNGAMTQKPTFLITRYFNNLAYTGMGDNSYATNIASADSKGYWIGTTNGSTTQSLYKNGTVIISGISNLSGLANNNLYIGAANAGGTSDLYSSKNYALISIGEGLSATQSANLYNIIQAFQTSLSRQV